MIRRVLTIALCACLLGIAACNGDDDDADATSTSEPTTATSPAPPATSPPTSSTSTTTTSSTTSPTLVTVTTAPSPTLDPTTPVENEDWVAVLQQLVNVRDELYATSDPSRAGEVCAEGAFCYDQLVAQLTDAQSKGWRVVDQGPITVVSAELENNTAENGVDIVSVRADLLFSEQHGRVVDASGNTVYELVPDDPDAPPERVGRYLLVRQSAGWRILEQEEVA